MKVGSLKRAHDTMLIFLLIVCVCVCVYSCSTNHQLQFNLPDAVILIVHASNVFILVV